jgi:hypothetical protein
MKSWAIKVVLVVIALQIVNFLVKIWWPFLIGLIVLFIVFYFIWKLKINTLNQPKNIVENDLTSSDIRLLTQELDELGSQEFIMPIQMFQLANKFVEHVNSNETIAALTNEKYIHHSSAFVRRVVIIVLRRKALFDNPKVVELVYQKLSDPEAWVAYDAAWFFKEAKVDQEKIKTKLTELAADKINLNEVELKKLSDEFLSDSKVRLQIEATEALRSNIINSVQRSFDYKND